MDRRLIFLFHCVGVEKQIDALDFILIGSNARFPLDEFKLAKKNVSIHHLTIILLGGQQLTQIDEFVQSSMHFFFLGKYRRYIGVSINIVLV